MPVGGILSGGVARDHGVWPSFLGVMHYMTLPRSFANAGFQTYTDQLLRQRFRGLMIGTEGRANSGKSEFFLSGPGGTVLALDRGYEQCLDNDSPPETRNADAFAFKRITVPLATQMSQANYQASWVEYLMKEYLPTLAIPESRMFVVDGESDSWEWQTLAGFGKLTQIPPLMRTELNAARRAMYARAKDSGKICLFTHRLKKQYETVYDANGKAVPDPIQAGKDLREWFGQYERSGYGDHEYLFALQLRHLYEPATTRPNAILHRDVAVPARWGVQIMMCKSNRKLEGDILWGDDCNLPSLLQYVYPQIDLKEWGY